MDKERFIHSYQSLKFQESDKDVFTNAIIKRKCLALNFFASIEFGEDNTVTDALLQDDLKEYGKIVDEQEPGSVNNYADYILASISQCQNENKKQWKTALQEPDLKEFLKPLSCNRSNDELSCKSLKITEEHVKQFKFNYSKKIKDLFPKSEDLCEDYDCRRESLMKLIQIQPAAEAPTKPVHIERLREFSVKQAQGECSKEPAMKPVQAERPREFSTRPIILRRGAKPAETNFKPKAGPSFEPDVVEDPKPKPGSFKTARDELHVQNIKKYGNSGNNMNESNYNYGCVKKSLGTRKGGVFNKFQPPVKVKEEMQPLDTKSNDPEEILDERLKNIDPKMIELIKSEIMDCGTTITWDDIAGLELAKNTIQEIVVWPMLRPDIFTGLRRPPKGILLFGPPGTGKTLIGKCIASQSHSTFFSISASSLTSKWIGDGEKMVRALFAVAKVHQPAVVFIDEIDSLLSQRSDNEHESSRRIKTEFLVQLDGAGTGDEDRILIIGATNRPQELDEAARRRLVKRLYIPLPDEKARKQMIRNLISSVGHCLSELEIEEIAMLTKGYSGADMKNLCQEASLGPIRAIPPMLMQNIKPDQVRPLNASDFKSALARIKSSVSEKDLDTYLAWDRQYGCGSSQ